MSVQVKTGSFDLTTGAASTTQAITGVGFKPVFIILTTNGQTGSTAHIDSNTTDLKRSFGVGTSSSNRRCASSYSKANSATTSTAAGHRADSIVAVLTGTTYDGWIDLQSLDSDGFTLVVSQQISTAYRMHYLAVGGDEILNATTGAFQNAASTNLVQSVTGVGFKPDFVLLFGGHPLATSAPPSTVLGGIYGVGFAAGNDANTQMVLFESDRTGVGTSQTRSYQRSGRCVASYGSGFATISTEASLVSFDSDGFTLNWLNTNLTNVYYHYLAVKGGEWSAGALNLATGNGSAKSVTGLNFPNKGGMFLASIPNTVDDTTANAPDNFASGFFDGTSNTAKASQSKNGSTGSIVILGVTGVSALAAINTTATTIGAQGTVGLDPAGFTFTNNVNVLSGFLVYFWTVGSAEWSYSGDVELS